MARAVKVADPPAGLVYRPEFVTTEEEQSLVETIERLEFQEVRMRGQVARRTVRHFGYDYDYDAGGRIAPGAPLPADLEWLRDRCAGLAELPAEELAQTLVSRYPPGAPIGWHRDAPAFGAKIVGVSLLSSCTMRLRRNAGEQWLVYEQELEPRSAYVMGGAARSVWQHGIPAVKEIRYSLTFRTLRKSQRSVRGSA